jgi:RNase H-fold protein (predicted Holliday junction resolvase)
VFPLVVLAYAGTKAAADVIAGYARQYGAEWVVVGLPTDAHGEETPACRRSHALASSLQELGLRVGLQPEYLTTNEARRRARDAGLPPGRPVDHVAAQVVLEEYLGA